MHGKSKFLSLAPLVGLLLLSGGVINAQSPDRSMDSTGGAIAFPQAIRNIVAWPQDRLNPTVSGRVLASSDQNGRGAAGAMVILTDGNGLVRFMQANWFGYYRFTSVVGEFCVVRVEHKRYRYDAQFTSLNEDVTGLNFVPLP